MSAKSNSTSRELSDLLAEYEAGRLRHFRPYCVRFDAYTLDVEVLTHKADDSGDVWCACSVQKNGEVAWFKSKEEVLEALTEAGLAEAYEQRFDRRDGTVYLNW